MSSGGSAPGELELVRAFVNTLDIEDALDELAGPAQLRRWLAGHGLLRPRARVPKDAWRAALEVREALRSLLVAHNDREADPGALEALDRAARRARLELRFDPDGSARLEPAADGVDGALGRLLAVVSHAMADGTWSRLKACRADDCRWAFYDHAKNQSRTWCSMAVCGNRAKARAYRRRRLI